MKALVIHDFEQGSPEWYEARRGVATASDFGSIITPKTGEYSAGRHELMFSLIDQVVRPEVDESFGGNRYTERGKELEPEAFRYYEAFYATAPMSKVGFIYNPELDAGCSPDGAVGDKGGIEIKCPDGKTHIRYLVNGTLPDEYKAQVHGNIAVSRRAWWDFVSYCPGYRPLVVRVVRNEYTAKLELLLKKFSQERLELMAKITAED